MLHGAISTQKLWSPLIPEFPTSFQVIVQGGKFQNIAKGFLLHLMD